MEQAANKIDQLQSETVAKNLLEKGQLDAMVRSNIALSREVEYLRNTVDEEQTAIKELAKFMYEKNRVTDALVMIASDHQRGMEVMNLDVLNLGGGYDNMFGEVNGAKRDILLVQESVAEVENSVKTNAETNHKQFKDVYTKLAQHQKSTDEFKAWVEGELKMLISDPPAGDVNQDIIALKVDLKHTREYIGVMRDNFMNKSCDCSAKMERIEGMLKDQKTTIKDMLEDYNEFKDDFYLIERVSGNAVDKVLADARQLFVTKEEIQTAFKDIHENIIAAKCNCNSANSQHQQQESDPNPEGMVVDP